jgi:hypothetical protein
MEVRSKQFNTDTVLAILLSERMDIADPNFV